MPTTPFPLPFNLRCPLICPPTSCTCPSIPLLPPPGPPSLHSSISAALTSLFTTFYSTSLRYLGISEILDWTEGERTVERFVLRELQNGKSVAWLEGTESREKMRRAVRAVIRGALDAQGGRWGTSLREVGFSSGMSMAYEGITSQLLPSHTPNSAPPPLPCLHTLLTPSGLTMLLSSPASPAFPLCPPRSPASPSSLLSTIRELISSGLLAGPDWSSTKWRKPLRRVFNDYQEIVKQVASEVLGSYEFSEEYMIFLEEVVDPLQLFLLVKADFEVEFGKGACRGLLGVGEVGGDNLEQVMRWCREGKGVKLLRRIRTRSEEDVLKWVKEGLTSKQITQREREREEDERSELIRVCGEMLEEEDNERKELERETMERDRQEENRRRAEEREKEELVRQGSSRDLLVGSGTSNPFAACAPRVAGVAGKKGKGRAVPKLTRYPTPPSTASPRSNTPTAPASSRVSLPPIHLPPRDRPPPVSAPRPSDSTRESELEQRILRQRQLRVDEGYERERKGEEDEHDHSSCCQGCAAEMLSSTMAPLFDERRRMIEELQGEREKQREFAREIEKEIERRGQVGEGGEGEKKKKKKKKGKKKKAPEGGVEGAPPSRAAAFIESLTPSPPPTPVAPALCPPPLAPECCPPDRCTGDDPRFDVWDQVDNLLYETFLAGFKYELIDSLVAPLTFLRDSLVKQYLLMGGRMISDDGKSPMNMERFLAVAEQGLWRGVGKPGDKVVLAEYTRKVLARSMQKLMAVLRPQLGGEICMCRLSNCPELLVNARDRLKKCELADRRTAIQLEPIDHQTFIKFCHAQLKLNHLGGPEWDKVDRAYYLADFLFSFSDAFDNAIDRLVRDDPYVLVEDLCAVLEWSGGQRMLDMAIKLGRAVVPEVELVMEVGLATGQEKEKQKEEIVLEAVKNLLETAGPSESLWLKEMAEKEKKKGNLHFAAGEYKAAIVCFETASLIDPTDVSYHTNAAAARIKLKTPEQFSAAICDCTNALFYDPTNLKALYRRGTALAMLSRWDDAIEDLSELVSICPENQPARDSLVWALKKRAAQGRASGASN